MQGSGKTLAFAIPIVQSLLHERARLLRDSAAEGDAEAAFDFGDPQNAASMAALTRSDSGPLRALVLCPTRELALQVRHGGLVSTVRALQIRSHGFLSVQPGVPSTQCYPATASLHDACAGCLLLIM